MDAAAMANGTCSEGRNDRKAALRPTIDAMVVGGSDGGNAISNGAPSDVMY